MAAGDKITNPRIAAVFEMAAWLDMSDTSNTFLRTVQQQPDGIYAEANLNEMTIYLKWRLGVDNQLAKWWPREAYDAVVGKIINFSYNEAEVGEIFLPPENAAGGVGETTCDVDAYGDPARTPISFKINETTLVWTEQAAGSEAGGTWTFSESAGKYVICWDDYLTTESFPTKYLTVT